MYAALCDRLLLCNKLNFLWSHPQVSVFQIFGLCWQGMRQTIRHWGNSCRWSQNRRDVIGRMELEFVSRCKVLSLFQWGTFSKQVELLRCRTTGLPAFPMAGISSPHCWKRHLSRPVVRLATSVDQVWILDADQTASFPNFLVLLVSGADKTCWHTFATPTPTWVHVDAPNKSRLASSRQILPFHLDTFSLV